MSTMIDYSVLQAGIACENIDPACYEMVREDFFEEVSGIDFFEKAEGKSSKTNMSPEEIAAKKAKAKQLRKRILKVAAFIAVVGVAVRVATKVLPEREVKKLESEYGKLKSNIDDIYDRKWKNFERHSGVAGDKGVSDADYNKECERFHKEYDKLDAETVMVENQIKKIVARANRLIDTFHLKCKKMNYVSSRDFVNSFYDQNPI